MGYDFMVSNSIGALPHRATLVREDDERLTWLSTDYACQSSPTCSFGSGTSHSGFTRFNPVEFGRGAVEPLNRG